MIKQPLILSIILLFSSSTAAAATSSISTASFEPDPDIPPEVNAKAPSLSKPNPASYRDIIKELAPCLEYVKGREDKPSKDCCRGAEDVIDDTKTKQERQAIRWFLKAVLPRIGKYDPRRVPQIPKQCGLSVDLPPVDAKFDGSKSDVAGKKFCSNCVAP